GVVYSSADSTPEIGETDVTKNDNGTGTDTFSETTTGLAQGTKYYVRAYATNIEGTSYGSVEEFTTPTITMALTPAEALTEENLDTNSFTVALSYVTFTDETLDPANFTLNNAPTGVGIESVEYTDTTHCTVNLAYDDTDFDSNVTTFSLTIAVAELSEGEDLTSDELTITATVEPAPTVTSLSPRRGRILGGTSVTIYGTNFEHVTAVYFGEEEASSYIVVSETKITAVSPAGSVGTVHVTVTTKGGTSAETSANKFAYYRKSSSSSGLNDDDTETHAVTFRDWDGTVLKIQIVEDGKSASAPQVPEREGYTFTGWDKEYSEITENMAVTAKYTANIYGTGVYTITFNSNGGSIVKSQSIPYGGNVKDPDDPVRDGYTFGGWYLDAGFTQKYDFTSAIGANVTLYAKWIPNEGTEQTALPLEVEFTFAQGDGWECVTANFTAHGIGSEGAEITWSSSDPDVIRMEQGDDGMIGIVTRPQGHDESVVLTVTATEDNNTVSRTFLLIVRQEGVSAAETYAETGRTASAQSGNSAGSEPIYRSALDNDTKIDSVALTADTVRKLIEQGGMSDSIVMTIGDFAADPASEYAFEVLSEAIAALSQNELGLTLASPAGTVEIPAEEIERAAQSGTMICFRIMQARDETEEAKADFLGDPSVFSKPDMTGKVIGVPKKIETNLEDLAAAVILPVKGLSEEQMADEAFLKTLGVYVEHSGGTTELVDGTLVYEDGEPVGIRFEINGFSRFQVVSVEEAVVTEPAEAAPSLWIWIACAAAGLAVLVAVFLIAIRRKKESRENARS
nr:InlB B-repeat-containing protein [Oscillospiraceae bacterium]